MPRPCPSCCEPDPCPITLVACTICNGTPVVGVTVTLTQGGATVATCTTNSGGCCTFLLSGLPGTYTVSATYTASGTTITRTWTGTLACGDTRIADLGCRTITVHGCNVIPQVGATVELMNSSSVVLGVITTDAEGRASWGISGVTRLRVTGGPRYQVAEGPLSDFVVGTLSYVAFLVPLAGYYCCPGCTEPLPICDTVTLTDPAGVPVTLTRTGTSDVYVGCGSGEPETDPLNPCVGAGLPARVNEPVPIRYEFNRCQGSLLVSFVGRRISGGNGTVVLPGSPLCYDEYDLVAGYLCPNLTAPTCASGSLGLNAIGQFFPDRTTALSCEDTVTYSYTEDLGRRDLCGTPGRAETRDHPLAYIDGWGISPTWTVEYDCGGGGAMMALSAPDGGPTMMMASPATMPTSDQPSYAEMQASAAACPHREKIPDDERAGCGCAFRCRDGRGNRPGGGTDLLNCWNCPIAPRRTAE